MTDVSEEQYVLNYNIIHFTYIKYCTRVLESEGTTVIMIESGDEGVGGVVSVFVGRRETSGGHRHTVSSFLCAQ